MGALSAAFTAAFQGPNGNGTNGDGTPYRPKPSDAAALGAAVDNAIPNAQDLSAETTRAVKAEAAISATVTAEVARAEQAEAAIDATLAAEVTRAEQAEAAIDAALAAEASRAEQAEAAIGASVENETTRAVKAEAAISATVAAEVTRAEQAEAAIDAALAAEASRAERAETSISASVTDEATRAGKAEATISAAVSAEVARAEQAEASIDAALAAEVSRADQAETVLGGRIDDEAAARGDADAVEAAARVSAFVDLYALAALSGRPGDAPSRFTSDLAASGSLIPPNYVPAQTAAGRTMRISGAGMLAPVAFFPVEPGQTAKVRTVIQRVRDTADPAGDAVGLFIAWYDGNRQLMATVARVAISALAVADGLRVFGALVSPDLGDASFVRPPAGAAYLRPYVQTWGDTAVTDVAVLAAASVADVLSPDLDALFGRVGAVEQRLTADLAARSRSFIRTVMFGG